MIVSGVALVVAMVMFWKAGDGAGMSVGEAIVLGVVEGLTEYLPVSSTGHLILTQRLLGIGDATNKAAADAFAICIQGGAIMAVLGLYVKRVRQMAMGVLGRDAAGRKLAIEIVAAFVPAAVIGLLLNKVIKDELFNLWAVVIAWIVGGAAILVVSWRRGRTARTERRGMDLADLSWKLAMVIGVAQCIAMWPGVSRSLITIVGGVLVGLSLPAAVEFSFLLGVVTLGAATVKDGYEHGRAMLEAFGPAALAAGFIAAWISAVIAIRWMVSYLQTHSLSVFGYYRIALGLATAAAIAAGWISSR
jgi:undecaprenyl-diphosphatase